VEAGHSPQIRAKDSCVVFDVDAYEGKDLTFENKGIVKKRCGERVPLYWNKEMQAPVLLHFRASEKDYRLLAHYYGIIYFTDPVIENYYRRFVRDFLHYHDTIYCAAGKIVKAVQAEGEKRGFSVDAEGAGGFSTLHVRRGDLQYKKVKIPAEEWYENTKEIWKPGEILYIATDGTYLMKVVRHVLYILNLHSHGGYLVPLFSTAIQNETRPFLTPSRNTTTSGS